MENIILTNDQLISQVQSNSKDIATLKSNTKWLYKYGGVGGKGGSTTPTSDPIVTANINGLYAVENGKDIPLNGTGSYTLNISVSKAGGKSFKISGSYAPIKESDGRGGTLGTKVVSFDAGYTVSYNITIPYNMNVSFIVDSGDGEFRKQITFKCITIPYVFNISFIQNNGVEHISPDGSLFLSTIKSEGLKIKFDYSFYIKCTASYDFKQNFLIESDNLSGNFDLTQEKEGSIILNVSVEQYSEINAGQYYFTANIKVTPDESQTISLDPITKNCFIIPNTLFLMVYTENANNHLYYNTRNTYYSRELYNEYNELINKEANKTINEEEKERLNTIKQNITFSNNGIIGMILKGYYGRKNGKTFTIAKITVTDENNNTSDLIVDYSTIYEQTPYTITPNISYTGEVKITFYLRYQGQDPVPFIYYLYCVKPISSFDWLPNNITTNYQHYYRGGEIKGGFFNEGLSSIDLNSNLDDFVKLCKIPSVQLGNTFDVLINIGFQYNAINDTSKLLFDIYSDAESETASQHIYIYQNVAQYNGQNNLDIYLPQEHEFNKLNGSKYHLLTIHKHLITNNASEVDIYIDGSLEATFSAYVTENLYFNSIDCYPANYSVNLAEIIYIPRNVNSELHNYFDDVSISQYWYKYDQIFRNGVNYNEKNITLLTSLYKLSEDENLSDNNFNISLETINNIASNVDCPVLMLTIDCASQLNNRSFKTSWFTLSNTTLRQIQVKNIYWSKGLSNVSLVSISSNYNWFIDIQGTSSLARKVKNLTLFTEPSDSSYPNRLLFSPNFTMEDKNSFLPEEQFNLKADIVDSSHANNTSIGQFVNEHTTRFEDAQQQNAYAGHIKNCLTGFPVLLFIDEIIKNSSGEEGHTYYYYGIFNFDLGRESYFNLGYKSTEVFDNESFAATVNGSNNGFITYEIPNGQNQLFNSILVAEILENNINGQNPIGGQVFDFSQFSSEKILFGDVVSENPLVDYNGMFGKLKFSNNLSNVRGIIVEFVKNIAKSGAACFKKLNKNMSDNPYYGYEYAYSKADPNDNTESLNFVPNFLYQADRNNEIDHPYTYPVEFGNANNDLTEFINNSNNYQQQLLDTICPYQGGSEEDPPHKVYLDYNSLVEYFVTCMAFGLVDSVLKNMNIKTWTANADLSNIAKWYIAFYDMDTCLGRDNKGIKTSYFAFTDYWKSNDAMVDDSTIEAQKIKIYRDFYPAKLTNEEGAGYDIPSSYLFAIAKYANYLIQTEYWKGNHFNTPQDLWTSWRQPGAILENAQSFMNKYFTNHLSKIPEALISYNYRFKYVWQTNTGNFDSNELPSFHGRGTYEVLDWLIKRFHILDAYFNLCRAKDYITFYKTDTSTWENTSLTEIYPININEATNNDDIVIFKSLSATNMTYTKTALSSMTFYVKAPELTPFILYLKEGAYVYRYLLNDPERTYKITINNAGNQDFFLGGSSEWIEFGGAHALIENNVLTCISNNLQVLSATEGTCTVWNFDLPALQKLTLTSKNYSGNLTIGYGENDVSNLTSLSTIDISKSGINLNINRSNIKTIIANSINAESLVIRNSNNIQNIQLNNSFISYINISNSVANLIDFSTLRFEKLEINGTGEIEDSSIDVIDDPNNHIHTLRLEALENVKIQNATELNELVLSNNVIKKLSIINSNLRNLQETYQEDENQAPVENSIYVESKLINSYTDFNTGKIIYEYRRILHLEKLVNLEAISFEGTLGFTTVILPKGKDVKLLSKAFWQTDLEYIDYLDDNNNVLSNKELKPTLILCDDSSSNNAGSNCKIFYNSRFALTSSNGSDLNFGIIQDKYTTLEQIFAINKYGAAIDQHNGIANIRYEQAVKFIRGLQNKEFVTSLYKAFFRQENLAAYLDTGSHTEGASLEDKIFLSRSSESIGGYSMPYEYVDTDNKPILMSFNGYYGLESIVECFEYCKINFINKNLFENVRKENSTLKLHIENSFEDNTLKFVHINSFEPISGCYEIFLFINLKEDGAKRQCDDLMIYDDLGTLEIVNLRKLIFGTAENDTNKSTSLTTLSGFNIKNGKLDFRNLFAANDINLQFIYNVFTNINQSNKDNICINVTEDSITSTINTLNYVGLKDLPNLTIFKNSFICDSKLSLDNVKNSSALIDICNLFDWDKQSKILFNDENKYGFNFYKKVNLEDASWKNIWRSLHLNEDILNIDSLFSNTVFHTSNTQTPVLKIPTITELNLSNINPHIKFANSLFANCTMFVDGTEKGLILANDTLDALIGTIQSINNLFAKCVLNGDKYPIPNNLLQSLTTLTSIKEIFAYTSIKGSIKTYNDENYIKEITLEDEDNVSDIYDNNTFIRTSFSTGVKKYEGYPILPPNLLSTLTQLAYVDGLISYSDFIGYIPNTLLSNNLGLRSLISIFEGCKIYPQLTKEYNNIDNIDIYNKPELIGDDKLKIFTFIPNEFLTNEHNQLNANNCCDNLFSFYLTLSRQRLDRVYLFSNKSLPLSKGIKLNNLSPLYHSKSNIILQWLNDGSGLTTVSNLNTWTSSMLNNHINIYFNFDNENGYEGLPISVLSNNMQTDGYIIDEKLSGLIYGYVFAKGTIFDKQFINNIKNLFILKAGLQVSEQGSPNNQLIYPYAQKLYNIILPPILYHSAIKYSDFPRNNKYWDEITNVYRLNKLCQFSNAINIKPSNIDLSFINNLTINDLSEIYYEDGEGNSVMTGWVYRYNNNDIIYEQLSENIPDINAALSQCKIDLEKLIYSNYLLLFNDWKKDQINQDTSQSALLPGSATEYDTTKGVTSIETYINVVISDDIIQARAIPSKAYLTEEISDDYLHSRYSIKVTQQSNGRYIVDSVEGYD